MNINIIKCSCNQLIIENILFYCLYKPLPALLLNTLSPLGIFFNGKPTPILRAAAVGTIICWGALTFWGLPKSSIFGKFFVGFALKMAEWNLWISCLNSRFLAFTSVLFLRSWKKYIKITNKNKVSKSVVQVSQKYFVFIFNHEIYHYMTSLLIVH